MIQIQQLTDDPSQKNTIVLDDGSLIVFQMDFSDQNAGWFITSLTYGTFTLNGIRIVASPNFLYQYKNQIPFGMACLVTNQREPTLQSDFLSGNAQLYVLSASEVGVFSSYING